jgi:hypothetical protein
MRERSKQAKNKEQRQKNKQNKTEKTQSHRPDWQWLSEVFLLPVAEWQYPR